jgi:drug/metabolite transporter (DMT)-like permease
MNRTEKLGTLAAIIGNGIFGFSFMFSRIALGVTTPFVMLTYRFILAFVLLNAVALWSVKMRKPAPERPGEVDWMRFDLRGRPVLPLLLMGIVQPVGYFLCESYGISLTNSTFAGVIIATGPLAGLVAGIFTLGEIPKKSQVWFSLISIIGVIIMILNNIIND